MTRTEYAKGLLDILKRGWTPARDTLEARYAMGAAEFYWLVMVQEDDRADFFAYARERIWLQLTDGTKVNLQTYLEGF